MATKLVNGVRIEMPQEELTELENSLAQEAIELAPIAYIQQRAIAYGALAEQLDMLWHDIDNETLDKTGEFYTHCKAVKDAIPKPE